MLGNTLIKKMYLVNTGLVFSGFQRFFSGHNSYLPVFAYIIEHPVHGPILFDTGLSSQLALNPKKYLGRLINFSLPFRTKEKWTLHSQLSQVYNPKDVKHIILSHRHFDHTGGVLDFPDALVWMTKEARKESGKLTGKFKGIKVNDIDKETSINELNFDRPHVAKKWGLFQSLDMFDDQSIFITRTPGHTKGHVSLVINSPKPILLAGDALYCSPNHYNSKKTLKIWNLLQTVYFFKKSGYLLATHDFIQGDLPAEAVKVLDPTGVAFKTTDSEAMQEIFA